MVKLPRLIFHVTEFEKKFRRRKHYNLDHANAPWIWTVSEAYFQGYNLSLLHYDDFPKLQLELDKVHRSLRGFAYEGAGTGLTILDLFLPWQKNYLDRFINEFAYKHIKTTYAGVGLAYARFGLNIENRLEKLDLVNQEFALDGWAFFKGCLENKDYYKLTAPSWLDAKQRNVFYRGLGRSLWFKVNGSVSHAKTIIDELCEQRQAIYWTGLAIGCAYAGKISMDDYKILQNLPFTYQKAVNEGFRIAKEARLIAGIESEYTSGLEFIDTSKPLANPVEQGL